MQHIRGGSAIWKGTPRELARLEESVARHCPEGSFAACKAACAAHALLDDQRALDYLLYLHRIHRPAEPAEVDPVLAGEPETPPAQLTIAAPAGVDCPRTGAAERLLWSLGAVVAIGLLLLPSLDGLLHARTAAVYAASLVALDGSGAAGQAHFSLEGDRLTVAVHASGLSPDRDYAVRIAGAMCPRSPGERQKATSVLLPLTTARAGATGTLAYSGTFTREYGAWKVRTGRSVVLAEAPASNPQAPARPIACGDLHLAAPGGDQDSASATWIREAGVV